MILQPKKKVFVKQGLVHSAEEVQDNPERQASGEASGRSCLFRQLTGQRTRMRARHHRIPLVESIQGNPRMSGKGLSWATFLIRQLVVMFTPRTVIPRNLRIEGFHTSLRSLHEPDIHARCAHTNSRAPTWCIACPQVLEGPVVSGTLLLVCVDSGLYGLLR